MAKFKFPPSIRSRPTYGTLAYKGGAGHIIIADDDGAEAILELASANPAMMEKTHIIFIAKESGDTYTEKLGKLRAAQLHIGLSYTAALPQIRRVLADAEMGVQIYLTGTEGLMGQAENEAMAAGFPHTAIQKEHRGSVARRMQCIHCKGITEDVMTNPFVCSHCGLNLSVRDHYSRRLAAFLAVRADAEDPGNVPEPVELYK